MMVADNLARCAGTKRLTLLILINLVMPLSSEAAVTLYSQDFEAAPVGQVANPTMVGLFPATINMGGSALQWEFTADGGAAGTKGMDVKFDGTGRPNYFINFAILEPRSSDENLPTSDPSKIRFSLDAKTVGAISPTPLRLRIFQDDPNYEADRGIDANMDGDMTDRAITFESVLSPELIQDGSYHRLSFTADQGAQDATISRVPPPPGMPALIHLTPEFDPTVTVHFSVLFGYEQFGFDAGNVVSVDNIRIEVIPEPSSIALAMALLLPLTVRRSRKRF
ncbi:MAG TPA: hypothetical protein VJ828_13450 [Lacipirellulaceae bacterium]|nr:hypothetical protein [Lacipirellulaceae bacterium]